MKVIEKSNKSVLYSFLLALTFLLTGCPDSFDPSSSPNTVIWTGAWENDTDFFGTFTLNITFDGEYMIFPSGEGTISGTVIWTGLDGLDLLSMPVTGIWDNDYYVTADELNYTLSSSDGRLVIDDTIYYETAGEITSNTFTIGSFEFDSQPGSWYTKISSDSTTVPDVTSAVLINQQGDFFDSVYINGTIYATVFDDPEYKLIAINISDGSVTEVTGLTCSVPMAIAHDGTDSWLIGKENSSDTDMSLFKYSGENFTVNTAGYPISHTSLVQADSISCMGSTLYFQNGYILGAEIGTINTSTAELTTELHGGFGGLPAVYRTIKLAAYPGGFYTNYFAPGGVWCSINQINTSGVLINSFYCPVNITGPVSLGGDKLYIIQENPQGNSEPNRLFEIQL